MHNGITPYVRAMLLAALVFALWCPAASTAEVAGLGPLLDAIRAVGPMGQGHREAVAAWPRLARARAEQIPTVLAGMDGANDLANNWIRAAAETVAARELESGGSLPQVELEKFLADARHSPRGRRLAYELIARVDPTAERRLIPAMLDDPCLELRYDAVAMALGEAGSLLKSGDRPAAIAAFRRAFAAARAPAQIDSTAGQLRKLGETVDLPEHYGFIMVWHLIGPFDNTEGRGRDEAYPPEREIRLSAAYPGKVGQVTWLEHAVRDEHGVVDLNDVWGRPKAASGSGYADTPESLLKFKGAVAYAHADFLAREPRDVELRMGCINASKVWVNGQPIMANIVYHTGMVVDQYAGRARLKQGRNDILVKIIQNEQPESWAQNWQFQLRICDAIGTAVLSTDRALDKPRSTPLGSD